MKILVANEREVELIKTLIDEIRSGDGLEEMFNNFEELGGVEASFVYDGLVCAKIEIDRTTEMTIDHNNLTGVCKKCGCATEGLIDPCEISYEEWLGYTKDMSDWMCFDCYNKDYERRMRHIQLKLKYKRIGVVYDTCYQSTCKHYFEDGCLYDNGYIDVRPSFYDRQNNIFMIESMDCKCYKKGRNDAYIPDYRKDGIYYKPIVK